MNSGQCLLTYSDADWAGDTDECRSISCYCVYIGKNLIFWSSRKQKAVARSSTEAEFQVMAATIMSLEFRNFW